MTAPLLVIAHEATRTGSPRVLLDLLRHVGGDLPVPLAVELLAEGPLAGELRALSSVDPASAVAPSAVLVNSAAAAAQACRYGDDVPAMAYVHEEGEALDVLPAESRQALASRFNRVLCVSDRSRADLRSLGVPGAIIRVLPPAVSVRGNTGTRTDRTGAPLVVGCGEAGWRKGADLFIDVARRVLDRGEVRFEWAGRRPRAFARVLDNDTAACGIDGRLSWLGELDDLGPLLDRAELLVMTSREDPRPLVPLEAAGHGVATAAFRIGGLTDLERLGAAATVPYPDTVALADLVLRLLDDDDRRAELVAAAVGARREHEIDTVGAAFLEELRALIAGGTR